MLVTNDGTYWYLAGGYQEPKESLIECAIREVHEETGLNVVCKDIIYCSECYDVNIDSHKVEIVFQAYPKGLLPKAWRDIDNSVTKARLFSLTELEKLNVLPLYLREGVWLNFRSSEQCYQGFESNE